MRRSQRIETVSRREVAAWMGGVSIAAIAGCLDGTSTASDDESDTTPNDPDTTTDDESNADTEEQIEASELERDVVIEGDTGWEEDALSIDSHSPEFDGATLIVEGEMTHVAEENPFRSDIPIEVEVYFTSEKYMDPSETNRGLIEPGETYMFDIEMPIVSSDRPEGYELRVDASYEGY